MKAKFAACDVSIVFLVDLQTRKNRACERYHLSFFTTCRQKLKMQLPQIYQGKYSLESFNEGDNTGI